MSANTTVLEAPRGDAQSVTAGAGDRKRLVSLDAFRGATIAAMLVVNDPGTWSAVYAPLRHAEWHGWTPTDLIFPFFLFIVGVAMTFSFARRKDEGADRRTLVRKIATRSAIIIGLGLVLAGFPSYDLSTIRIPGVLQRIGVAYFFGALIFVYTGWRTQAAIAVALLFCYWALQTLTPGSVLLPGQDLGAAIDRAVFGTEHLWSQSRTWDPEGLLSTMPAIATVLTGVFVGYWLRSGREPLRIAGGLAAAGAAAMVVGVLWGLIFPINKALWTSSYVVFTSGFGALVLASFYALIDVAGKTKWSLPFVVFGMNAIAAYFLASLGAQILGEINVGDASLKGWIYTHWFEPVFASAHNASLAFALSFTAFFGVLMGVLYWRKIFIKV